MHHRCNKCGHHHTPKNDDVVPCLGVNYDDEGGISRCGCRHTKHTHQEKSP